MKEVAAARQIIEGLLAVLPDSMHDDKSWEWAWNELSDEAQEAIRKARKDAEIFLG